MFSLCSYWCCACKAIGGDEVVGQHRRRMTRQLALMKNRTKTRGPALRTASEKGKKRMLLSKIQWLNLEMFLYCCVKLHSAKDMQSQFNISTAAWKSFTDLLWLKLVSMYPLEWLSLVQGHESLSELDPDRIHPPLKVSYQISCNLTIPLGGRICNLINASSFQHSVINLACLILLCRIYNIITHTKLV